MSEEIEVTIKIPNPPEGWVFDGFRFVFCGEKYFNGVKWEPWIATVPSNGKYLVAVKAKQYREPILPADAGRDCEFSYNGKDWKTYKLLGFMGLSSNDPERVWVDTQEVEFNYCRIEMEE